MGWRPFDQWDEEITSAREAGLSGDGQAQVNRALSRGSKILRQPR